MGEQQHKIERQVLELILPQEPGVRFAQDAFLEAYYAKMLPILEQVLDEMVGPDQNLQLDTLEIDLGKISLDFDHPELTFKLEAAIRKSLIRAFEEKRTLEIAASDRIPQNVSESQMLFHFLETGHAPSWIQAQKMSPPKLLANLLQASNPTFLRELLRTLSIRGVQRRLAWSFSPELKAKVVEALLPQYHTELRAHLDDLQQLHRAKAILPLSTAVFQFHLWESLLGAIPGISVASLSGKALFLRLTERLLPSAVFSGSEATWLLRESLAQLGEGKVSKSVAEAISYLEKLHAPKLKMFALEMVTPTEKALVEISAMPQRESDDAQAVKTDDGVVVSNLTEKQEKIDANPQESPQDQQPEKQLHSQKTPSENDTQGDKRKNSDIDGLESSDLEVEDDQHNFPNTKEGQTSSIAPANENEKKFTKEDEAGELKAEEIASDKTSQLPSAKTQTEKKQPKVKAQNADQPEIDIDLTEKSKSKVETFGEERQKVESEVVSEVDSPIDIPALSEEKDAEKRLLESAKKIAEGPSQKDVSKTSDEGESDVENVLELPEAVEDPDFSSKNVSPNAHEFPTENQAKLDFVETENVEEASQKEIETDSEKRKAAPSEEEPSSEKEDLNKSKGPATENETSLPKSVPPAIELPENPEAILDPIQERFKKFREMWATNPEALIPQSNSEALHIPWKTDAETGFEVPFAGLILLWPFIPHLFRALGWMEKSAFVDEESQWRAIIMLHFLATGTNEVPDEQNLAVCKLLVGLQAQDPVPVLLELDDEQRKEGDGLLEAVIANWAILKKTKPDGLRLAFLNRNGFLRKDDQGWHLKIERQTTDVLIDRIPWGISTIRLSWQPKMIFVEW